MQLARASQLQSQKLIGEELPLLYFNCTPNLRPFQKDYEEEACPFLPIYTGVLQIHTMVLHTARVVTVMSLPNTQLLDFCDDAPQSIFKSLPSLPIA